MPPPGRARGGILFSHLGLCDPAPNHRGCRVMFSSGNGTEKARMGKTARRGEVVVDLYAGIGRAPLLPPRPPHLAVIPI